MIKEVKKFIKKHKPVISIIVFDTPPYIGYTIYDYKKLRTCNKFDSYKLSHWYYDVKSLVLTLYYE